MEVQKIKKDPEVKNITPDETCTTADNNTDQSSNSAPTYRDISTSTSPEIKILRDNLAELEQDYCLFKEETSNRLQQLQSLINHPDTQHMQRLYYTVRQLEENNEQQEEEEQRQTDHVELTTTSPNSTNREERRKENVVILFDSNGYHLHQRRLFQKKREEVLVSHLPVCTESTERRCAGRTNTYQDS
ncbi:hypothetical protein E1301_Tti023689 [Triplophysa tibetana]|uniref:Uncharacterized protein n=1 Tax=Triplophysa tibetana TaxID=1572043 RepID=A0A5A9N9V4_9TELE|nr:hypothetical protein E1301_Tti023689 [Triplophysa tibetana]